MSDPEKTTFSFENNSLNFFPTIGLKLTGSCRLNCTFCCEPNRIQPIAPLSDMIKIVDALYSAGTRRLCLTGGDPLLYPDLLQLLMHTTQIGFKNIVLTADGDLLLRKAEILSHVSTVRLSVHEIGNANDGIVGSQHSFEGIERAISFLRQKNIPLQVTTVVTAMNVQKIMDIAHWCFNNGALKYYLFGLMKSGRGNSFVKEKGTISIEKLEQIYDKLNREYPDKIALYKYINNAECILVYGDGRIIIDPYPNAPTYQLEIGNVLSDSPQEIMKKFKQDPGNLKGYREHLKQI
jgi:MoaA/NifB/PqqE/SkfB family radical SAM enzyme